MKKIIVTISVLMLIVTVLGGCDFYSGKRPYDYVPSRWVSTSPDVWFIVDYEDPHFPKGEFNIYDSPLSFFLSFDKGKQVSFFHEDEKVLAGECRFGSEEFTVKIDQDKNYVYGKDVEEITFVREDYTPESKEETSSTSIDLIFPHQK